MPTRRNTTERTEKNYYNICESGEERTKIRFKDIKKSERRNPENHNNGMAAMKISLFKNLGTDRTKRFGLRPQESDASFSQQRGLNIQVKVPDENRRGRWNLVARSVWPAEI